MINKKGFTLAEILIALAVLAFLTSMGMSIFEFKNKQENIMGYRRAVHILNKAYNDYASEQVEQYETKYREEKSCAEGSYLFFGFCISFSGGISIEPETKIIPYLEKSSTALDPVKIGDTRLDSDDLLMENLFKPHIRNIDFDEASTMSVCPSGAKYFYTQDGMKYCFKYNKSAAVNDDYGEKTYGIVWVDVNGEKGPNRTSIDVARPGDWFPIVMLKNRFVPGHPTDSTVAQLAQDLYFGEL